MEDVSEPENETPQVAVLVLFGATGDLATRMLYPALARLAIRGVLPDEYALIGTGRHEPDDGLDTIVAAAVDDAGLTEDDGWSGECRDDLMSRVTFTASSSDSGEDLAATVEEAERRLAEKAGVEVDDVCRVLYLSIPPEAMEGIVEMIDASGLSERARLVIEKPFGYDLESAREMSRQICSVFDESSVFRVDHFAAKAGTRALVDRRLNDPALSAQWDRHGIAEIRIDASETLGIEGRGSFYESVGCLRDMVTTHLAQVLGWVAMEPPASDDVADVRGSRAELFEALRPFDRRETVYGQYDGYRDEDDVADDSDTETYVALTAHLDNDRWRGVPIQLRSGKRLDQDRQAVEIVLRTTPEDKVSGEGRSKTLVFDLSGGHPSPYERVFTDVLRGDQCLFVRSDEVERIWEVAEPLLTSPPAVQPYRGGTAGPSDGTRLFED